MVLLPAMGIVAEIITVFSRKKLFAYKTVLYTVDRHRRAVSFFVWAHHQFVAGIDPRMANVFTVTTLLISIPIAEMMFVYIATLYGGSITLTTPMLWALAFIAEFLIGGVTGIFLGASGADIYFHDTYFVLAHFHYTFFPIAIIGDVRRASRFWFPKMFGRMMNETLGKIHFWGTIIPFNCIFIPLFMLGRGRRAPAHLRLPRTSPSWRRPAAGPAHRSRRSRWWSCCCSSSSSSSTSSRACCAGQKAEKNPWQANTLEWTAESPPPHGNWPELPTVLPRPLRVQRPGPRRRLLAAERAELSRRRTRRCPQDPIATTRSATGMPTGRLAVWWVIASEIVIFGGLLALVHHAPAGARRVRRSRRRTPTPGSARSTRSCC